MAEKKASKFPEENKLADAIKSLRKKADGREMTSGEKSQLDNFKTQLAAMRFKRMAVARVNKTLHAIGLIGNLGKYRPTPEQVDKMQKAFQDALTEAFTRLRGTKAAAKGGFTL